MNSAVTTVVQGLLVIYLAWSSYAISDLQRGVAVLSAQLQNATDDRYRRSEAVRDHAHSTEHRQELQRRIERLERLAEVRK